MVTIKNAQFVASMGMWRL